MKIKSTEIFVKSPGPKNLVFADSFYTKASGGDMMRTKKVSTRSDITDSFEYGFSSDNGRTWSEWQSVPIITQTPNGPYRKVQLPGCVDLKAGRLVLMMVEGLYPTDNPLDGMKNFHLSYKVSTDGGKSFVVDEQVIQRGNYTTQHPFQYVWVGKNCIMNGSWPYFRSKITGKLIFPMQITPLGPNGEYYNPGGGYTYTEAVALIGRWKNDMRIEWEISERIAIGPDQSTRGAIEPTIAEMPDGRMLMVLRASNDKNPQLPATKWYAVSVDGGYSWSKPQQWGYDDGTGFYSPSSISMFLMHSNGRIYWFGNIVKDKPVGNMPRHPLVVGKVDPSSLKLIKKSIMTVDELQPGEDPSLQLSNFYVHEDRENGDIVLHLSRFTTSQWYGDAYIYRLEP